MQSLILAIAALLLFAALPYLITYRKVLKQTFWCFRPELVSPDLMPEHLKKLFQPTIAKLETYGFQVVEYHLIQSMTGSNKRWNVLLQHHRSKSMLAALRLNS